MKFSKEIDIDIANCRNIAIELGSNHISSFHFILALIKTENLPNEIFKNRNWNFAELFESILEVEKKKQEKYHLTKEFEKALKIAIYYSWIYNFKEVKSEHIILALLADKKSCAGEILTINGLNYFEFKTEYEKISKLNANKLLEIIGTNYLTVTLKIPQIMIKIFNKNVG